MIGHRDSRHQSAREIKRIFGAARRRRGALRVGVEPLEARALLSGNPPTALPGYYAMIAGHVLTKPAPAILAADTSSTTTLTASVVANPANGTLTLNTDGAFTYTPNASFVGTDSFTYKTNDGTLDSSPATVTIAVNSPATALPGSYPATRNTQLTIALPGVLLNDTDADGKQLTAAVVANPVHGSLNLNSNGSFTYTPSAGFVGTDSFTYKANDGTYDSSPAVVSIVVNGPVTAAGHLYSTQSGTTLSVNAPGVLQGAADTNNKPIISAAPIAQPAHGSLTLNTDGSFTYVPNAGFHGTDSFTYTATDGTDTSAPATVNIKVIGPVTVINHPYSTAANNALAVAAPGVLQGANKPALSAAVVTQPARGTLTLNSADGSFTYVPDTGFVGTDSFTYTATDGTDTSDPALVTINVTDPVTANGGFATTLVNTQLSVSAPGVLAGAKDAGNLHLTAVLLTSPAHGALTLNADGSYTYMPTSGFIGMDSFTYKATDGDFDSLPATVLLSVTSPVTVDNIFATTKLNQTLVVAAPGVLAGAQDQHVGGQPLTAILSDTPAHGSVTLHPDGSYTYVPETGYIGNVFFSFKAFDGTYYSRVAVVTINIHSAAVANNDAYTTTVGNPLNVAAPGVLGNDTDANQNTKLTPVVIDQPTHGSLTLNDDGSFSYVPNAGFAGFDHFDYMDNDGTVNSNLAPVVITVNGPVVALDQTYTATLGAPLVVAAPGLLTGATDTSSGKTLTAAMTSSPISGSVVVNSDGSFTYTPSAFATPGTDDFTFRVSDGTNSSNLTTVTINLVEPTSGPVVHDVAYTTAESVPLAVMSAAQGVLASASDPSGKPLSAIAVAQPAHGTLALNSDGTFTYTPNANFSGTDSFTYKANDGTADSNVATVTLQVLFVNQPPTINSILDVNIKRNSGLQTVSFGGITPGPGDPPSETVTVNATSDNHAVVPDPHVIYSGGATGSLQFTPVAGATGQAIITVTVKNNGGTANGGSDTTVETFKVNVLVNVPPTLQAIVTPQTVTAGQTVSFTASAQDTDGDALSFSLGAGAPAGAAINATTGAFTWAVPVAQTPGDYNVTVLVTDNGSPPLSASQVVTIHVNAPAVLEFAQASLSANETDGSFTVTINRTVNTTGDVTVVLSGTAGHGVAAFTQQVTISAGATSKTVTIPIANDGQPGLPDASISLSLSSPGTGATLGSTKSATLVIHDNNPFPPPVMITSVQTPTIKVKTGTGKRAKTKSVTVIKLQLSAALNGAGNLRAYHLLTGKTKKGVTTFNKNVSLGSVTYDPVGLTVTLFTSGKLNLSQPMQLRVTASLLTDSFGRALDGNHDGQPGGDFAANLGKGGVRILAMSPAKPVAVPAH
jgi:VCBS repeat-containing protein